MIIHGKSLHVAKQISALVCLLLAFAFFTAGPMPASAQFSKSEEFDFANRLIDLGFKDYAKRVIDGLPGADSGLTTLFDGRLLMGSGKFDEAEVKFKEAKDDESKYKMLMRLADVHFGQGRIKKSSELYEYVFERYKKVPTDEVGKEFYLNSAYKYFKLMQMADNTEKAIDALERVTSATTDEGILRQTSVDLANLKVDLAEVTKDKKKKAALLKDARRICDQVFLIPDKSFGDAISVLVRIELIDDNYDRALDLIRDYTPMCHDIEKVMLEHGGRSALASSPIAPLRLQKGNIYMMLVEEGIKEKDGKKVQQNLGRAFQEYVNTFYKYKDSEAGVAAAIKVFETSNFAKDKFGATLEPDGGRAAIFGLMVESAHSMYGRKMYKEANEAYKRILKSYPVENPKAADALTKLAFCNIAGLENGQLDTETDFADLMPQVIAGYLADRFRGNQDAGSAIYKIGSHYLVKGDERANEIVWGLFANGFPDDPRSAGIYFVRAENARKLYKDARTPGKHEEALYYYKLVAQEKYKDDIHYIKALDRLAEDYLEREDYKQALAYFNQTRVNSAPGMQRAISQFKISNCLYSMGDYPKCIAFLENLKTMLASGGVFDSQVNFKPVNQLTENVMFRLGATNMKLATEKDKARKEKISADAKANFANGMDKTAAREAANKANPPSAEVVALWTKAQEHWEEQTRFFRRVDERKGTGKLAPKALEGMGQILMAKGEIDEALKTFQSIAQRYEDTPEAERVYFYLVREGLKLELDHVVDRNVKGMIDNPDTYSAVQLIQVGQLLVDEEKYAEGRAILQAALTHEQTENNKGSHQRVLKALVVAANRSGAYQECVDAGNKMLEKYEKTPYKFAIYREMASAYRELKNCKEAESSIRWVFEYAKTSAKDPKLEMLRANLELARIQAECDKEAQAVQSYWRITQRPPPDFNAEAIAREALAEGAAYSAGQKAFPQCMDIARTYLTWFPLPPGQEPSKEYENVLRYAKEAKSRLNIREPDTTPEAAPAPASEPASTSEPAPAAP